MNSKAGISEGLLYVNVNVLPNGSFKTSISFDRLVFYRTNGKWFTTKGSTWDRGGTGYATGDRDYILSSIAGYV